MGEGSAGCSGRAGLEVKDWMERRRGAEWRGGAGSSVAVLCQRGSILVFVDNIGAVIIPMRRR